MKLLAVSTSARVASAAVFVDGVCAAECVADTGRKHAETLMPLIDAVLREAGTPLADMDLLAVDVGPGSFTGVRIGVSAVNALGMALAKPIVPVDALRALYETDRGEQPLLCSMIDAGNGNAYAALYAQGRTVIAPSAVEIGPFLAALPENTALVGDVNGGTVIPTARSVGSAALSMTERTQKAVTPLYLRASQAERLKARRAEASHD